MKVCGCCKLTKELTEFNKGSGKLLLQNRCRQCQSDDQKARQFQPRPRKHRQKKCVKCLRTFGLRAFYKTESNADGRVSRCKDCYRSDSLEHYEAKREFISERRKLIRVLGAA